MLTRHQSATLGLVMEIIFKYYGTDWLAIVLTFLSLYLLGQQKRAGFIYGLLANIAWLTFGMLAQSIANMVANAVFSFLNIRGFVKWSGKEKAKAE